MSYHARPTERPEGYGVYKGIHHIEFYTANAKQSADWMCIRFGFQRVAYRGLETESRDVCSHVIQQGTIRLIYTTALNPTATAVNSFVQIHGDAARDVAFEVDDCAKVFNKAIQEGAVCVQELQEVDGVVTAAVQFHEQKGDEANYGNCDSIHTFIQKPDGYEGFLPGYEMVGADDPLYELLPEVGLELIDHVVTNRGFGQYDDSNEEEKNAKSHMLGAAQWYKEKLGFNQFWSVDDTLIHTAYSALNSTVMTDFDRTITLPINEPAPGGKRKKSQIQEYVEYHGGAGVQHIALRTNNIITALTSLRARGLQFLRVPDQYYNDLRQRLGDSVAKISEDLEELQRLNILVDFEIVGDKLNYLLQIFTVPVEDRPTLFYEIIQRRGNEGFGAGNFKALFEAIELAQDERGNLTDMPGANGSMDVDAATE